MSSSVLYNNDIKMKAKNAHLKRNANSDVRKGLFN